MRALFNKSNSTDQQKVEGIGNCSFGVGGRASHALASLILGAICALGGNLPSEPTADELAAPSVTHQADLLGDIIDIIDDIIDDCDDDEADPTPKP